ncbi:MAG: TolC family protein [Verrucomicrobiaceae bacterium]|nr:TolC family protein [Verrucomicrobiaceae bacterium]
MRRPDYQQAQAQITAAQTDTALAHAKRTPDLTAGLFTAQEKQQGVNTGHVGIRFSIPLPFWNKTKAKSPKKPPPPSAIAWKPKLWANKSPERPIPPAAKCRPRPNSFVKPATRCSHSSSNKPRSSKKPTRAARPISSPLLRVREQRLQLESAALDAARDFHLARIRYEAATFSTP